jgi:AcrR family transcriptional regulator
VAGDSSPYSGAAPRAEGGERDRLIAAFARAASEQGYAKLTVEQVLRYAGFSQGTFEAHFESKEQGLVAAQDAFLHRLWLDVVGACDSTVGWPAKVRAALEAILTSLVETSALARVFAFEAPAASLAAAEQQIVALDRFASLLREGRHQYPQAASLPVATERALVGGIASIISSHLLMEDPQAIPALKEDLVELVLIPYLGESGARQAASA